MGSLFTGTPQTATSYATSTSETPQWMQDAIYNQIQWSQNIANKPYELYNLPTVAELSPLQQQAYQNVQANQGAWQKGLSEALGAGALGAANPFLNQASSALSSAGNVDTTGALRSAQSQYLNPALAQYDLAAAQGALGQAANINSYGAAQPYMSAAGQTTAQALSQNALSAANPYLQAASQSAAGNVGQYMSPYQQNVLDTIAKQGARNLTENLLPGVSDAFIKAGQFGSSRMGEFGSRALRDTQEAILNAQSQAAQQGYGQALTAAQQDAARQAQLASTVGSISGADIAKTLQGAQQFGTLGQTQGQLASTQMSNLTNLGQAQAAMGQAQQQYGLSSAQALQQAQAADAARQLQAAQAQGQLGQIAGTFQGQQQSAMLQASQQAQQARAADVASLEAAGQAQQAQQQQQLNAAYQQWQNEQLYPKQQLDWLNTQVRGMAPITPQTTTTTNTTTGATYSPSALSQIATAYYTGKALGG